MQTSTGGASFQRAARRPTAKLNATLPRRESALTEQHARFRVAILKLSRERDRAVQQMHVFRPRNLDPTESLQVRREPLGIEQDETLRAEVLDQARAPPWKRRSRREAWILQRTRRPR